MVQLPVTDLGPCHIQGPAHPQLGQTGRSLARHKCLLKETKYRLPLHMQVGTQIAPDGFKDLGAFHPPHQPLWGPGGTSAPTSSPPSEALLPAQTAERKKELRPREQGSQPQPLGWIEGSGVYGGLSAAPGWWEEVKGGFLSEASDLTANSGQCCKGWASHWPARCVDTGHTHPRRMDIFPGLLGWLPPPPRERAPPLLSASSGAHRGPVKNQDRPGRADEPFQFSSFQGASQILPLCLAEVRIHQLRAI